MSRRRTTTRRRGRRRGGLSLVEATIATVVVGLMVVAAMHSVGALAANQRVTRDHDRATMLAVELLGEVLAQAYEEPLDPPVFGREALERDDERSRWDDVDDYDGWSASPPQSKDGAPDPDLEGWRRSVRVVWANPNNQQASAVTDVKRITVTVEREGRPVGEAVAIRTAAWPFRIDDRLRVLMVVADAADLTVQERAREAMLGSWGCAVSFIAAAATQEAFDDAVARNEVAYVVEMQGSTILGTKLRDAPIGVVVEEAELRDRFGFSADRGWPSESDSVEVLDGAHELTTGFGAGSLKIFSSPEDVVSLTGERAGGLEVLCEHGSGVSAQAGLSVIEAGGALYGGGTAAARRVQMPWGRAGLDVTLLNDNGRLLLQRALRWAAKEEGP